MELAKLGFVQNIIYCSASMMLGDRKLPQEPWSNASPRDKSIYMRCIRVQFIEDSLSPRLWGDLSTEI